MAQTGVMDERQERAFLGADEQRELLRQGCRVLRSLGRRGLAREFARRAGQAPTREHVVELLLEYILISRSP